MGKDLRVKIFSINEFNEKEVKSVLFYKNISSLAIDKKLLSKQWIYDNTYVLLIMLESYTIFAWPSTLVWSLFFSLVILLVFNLYFTLYIFTTSS